MFQWWDKVDFSNFMHTAGKTPSTTLALHSKSTFLFFKGIVWPLVQRAEAIDTAVRSSSQFSTSSFLTGFRNCCVKTGVQVSPKLKHRCSTRWQQQLLKEECSSCFQRAGRKGQREENYPKTSSRGYVWSPMEPGTPCLPCRGAHATSQTASAMKHPRSRRWAAISNPVLPTWGSSTTHQKSWHIFIQIYLLVR